MEVTGRGGEDDFLTFSFRANFLCLKKPKTNQLLTGFFPLFQCPQGPAQGFEAMKPWGDFNPKSRETGPCKLPKVVEGLLFPGESSRRRVESHVSGEPGLSAVLKRRLWLKRDKVPDLELLVCIKARRWGD